MVANKHLNGTSEFLYRLLVFILDLHSCKLKLSNLIDQPHINLII